ncbi:MAG: hypothetical protein D6768_18060 [Chloroflexi bacterium]|nr:MAG: hypothetical protein D6768_18060 [Chloroflexota bacterium]
MLARLNRMMPALDKIKDTGFKVVVADQRRQSPGGLAVRQHLTLWSYLVVRSDDGQSAVWN